MKKEEGKIFVVTSGSYSDYRVERVFSTRKKALEFLDTKDDKYTLEVFDLDEPIERKTHIYEISFKLEKKKVVRVSAYESEYRCKDLIHVGATRTLDIFVESDSRRRALKIASERYGAVIAGEQTMYPYLRVGVLKDYYRMRTAFFDFHTGELVLHSGEQLGVELPSFIKVKRL